MRDAATATDDITAVELLDGVGGGAEEKLDLACKVGADRSDARGLALRASSDIRIGAIAAVLRVDLVHVAHQTRRR